MEDSNTTKPYEFDYFVQPADIAYITNPSEQVKESTAAVDAYTGIQHSLGYINNFDNILPGQSGRTEFTREAYEHFRPSESMPKKYPDIIRAIDGIYSSLSIVRNIIDLMSDFGSEGIELVHPVPSIEKFYKEWFKKVDGIDRSERFLSSLYRHGMVVIRKYHGNLNKKQRKNLEQYVHASEDIKLSKMPASKYMVPLKYIFYNPATFEHKNFHKPNEAPVYSIKIPKEINIQNSFEKYDYFNYKEVSLDSSKVYVAYYKKDDWKAKPIPFLFPIIKSAILLEKLTLCDSAALDGAVSKLRIIKLGDISNPQFPILPSPTTVSKLDQILRSNVSGGTIDVIWGPDIDLIESSSDISSFLGQDKYVPFITQIYEGLGIPSSFVGIGQGTTNNYISLKILMKRLSAGRARLIEFWEEQIKEVQMAMGFSEPAQIEFNNLELGDEESERNLLIQLLDRDIISAERIQKILGYDPRLENKRIMREYKERKSGRRIDKTGQFHNGEKEFTLQKVALERGFFAPEHVGLEKSPGSESIESPNEIRLKEMSSRQAVNPADKSNDSSKGPGGRPRGAKDTVKRKTPSFSPKIKASLDLWTENTQNVIHNILKETALSIANKKSFRELTTEETLNFEILKFSVLSNIEPFSKVGLNLILEALDKKINRKMLETYEELKLEASSILNKQLTSEDKKLLQKNSYINYVLENYSDENL